jgi:hypothetical protein
MCSAVLPLTFLIGQLWGLALLGGYGGPGQKSQDYSASDPEGALKHQIKIVYIR